MTAAVIGTGGATTVAVFGPLVVAQPGIEWGKHVHCAVGTHLLVRARGVWEGPVMVGGDKGRHRG